MVKELLESNSSHGDPAAVPQASASNSTVQIDPIAARDMMEQSAATIVGANFGEKSALSHYLEALQRPNITPKDLVIETNKLELAFSHKWGSRNEDALIYLDAAKAMVAGSFSIDPDLRETPAADKPILSSGKSSAPKTPCGPN
jgi:hypothetical protein